MTISHQATHTKKSFQEYSNKMNYFSDNGSILMKVYKLCSLRRLNILFSLYQNIFFFLPNLPLKHFYAWIEIHDGHEWLAVAVDHHNASVEARKKIKTSLKILTFFSGKAHKNIFNPSPPPHSLHICYLLLMCIFNMLLNVIFLLEKLLTKRTMKRLPRHLLRSYRTRNLS